MRDTTRFLSVLAVLVAFAAPSYAADEIGAVGTVAALQVYTPLADTYLQHHGKVTVKNTAGVLDVYRWGGVSCGTRVLTEAQVETLQRALGDKKTRIEPTYQLGQGDLLCLVGINLVAKSYAKDLLP